VSTYHGFSEVLAERNQSYRQPMQITQKKPTVDYRVIISIRWWRHGQKDLFKFYLSWMWRYM